MGGLDELWTKMNADLPRDQWYHLEVIKNNGVVVEIRVSLPDQKSKRKKSVEAAVDKLQASLRWMKRTCPHRDTTSTCIPMCGARTMECHLNRIEENYSDIREALVEDDEL